MPNGEAFIDASLFMGMHSSDEATRIACKGFFVERLRTGAAMSLEHVGKCDDIIWSYSRALQDVYYPFMDNLHTDMRIVRRGYEEADLRLGLESPELRDLPLFDRLLVAMVLNRKGTLYTVTPRLLARPGLPVQAPQASAEVAFPEPLERLYKESLQLRVPNSIWS